MAWTAGRHSVVVTQHQLGKSSTGTPHIAVEFEGIVGEYLTWYGYLTDAAIEQTLRSLTRLGWDAEKHDGRLESLHRTDLLVGEDAEIVVEFENYNGQSRPKVRWINEVGGGMGEGLGSDAVAELSESLRAKVLSLPRPQANPRPAGAPAKKAAPTLADPDDDLPF